MATITGTNGADTLNGTAGNDTIDARRGDDLVDGKGGDDQIDGGKGNDEIDGGSGDDTIKAGGGNNTISGGSGNDEIESNGGDDVIDSGNDDDTVKAGNGHNVITAGSGNDEIESGSGNDEIDAGSGDDTIKAGGGDNTIAAGDGNDEIESNGGDDEIDAGSGNDTIKAGGGDDVIAGGDGDDEIEGGDGNDTVVFSGSITEFTITTDGSSATVVGSGTQGNDTLSEVETLVFDDYTLDLTASNNAPAAFDDFFCGEEDTQITGNVLADNGSGADYDFEGDSLSVVAANITTANGGTVTLLADGSFTYDPAADYHGPDSFSYTLSDGSLEDTGTVYIKVTPVNDAPTAVDDVASTAQDTAVVINVVTNDNDPDDDALTISEFGQPENGTVAETSPGIFTYTPNAGFTGSDAFSYTITDGNGETSTADVVITVGDPPTGNTAPVALNASINEVIEGGVANILTIDFNTMTVNGQPIISDAEQSISDLDITSIQIRDGERLGVQFTETSPDSNVFTLDLDALNLDPGSFLDLAVDYTVEDGQATNNTSSGQINLMVSNPDGSAANTAPVAGDATLTQTEEQGLIAINLAAAAGLATDADNDPLTVTSLVFTDALGNPLEFDPLEASGTEETGGIVTLNPSVFGLADTETGVFLLNYTVSDGAAFDSGVVTLNLTGSDENTAPTTTPGSETQSLPDDIVLSTNNVEFDLNPLVDDIDQDELTIALVSITDSEGTITGTILDGVVSVNVTELELAAGDTANFVINYTVSDGIATPVAGTHSVTVDGPDAPPSGSVTEDFEGYASDSGFTIPLSEIAGLSFDGSATVFELDEMGTTRGVAPGLIAGETTIEQSASVPDGNAAIIEGSFTGLYEANLPQYAFTAYAPGATVNLASGPISTVNPFGTAFDLEAMSLTALTGPTEVVTIIPYRIEQVGFQYQYVAVAEFEVSVSSTSALALDFTSGDFSDVLIFNDPLTAGVDETSAFENIVAVQFVTTGELVTQNPENPLDTSTTPMFDDPLVIDDLIFTF